jgi:cytochrome oxidase Cu insertion factor (SCO1/SenC/PrrC family)
MKMSPLSVAALALGLAVSALSPGQQPEAAAAELPAAIAVGKEAPAFTLPGTDGASHALTDLRGKKDLVLVFFRGSW